MPKIYKPGKVALVLSGRYAGRKVVVIRQSDEGTKVGFSPSTRGGGWYMVWEGGWAGWEECSWIT
jgi:hypothetical protein